MSFVSPINEDESEILSKLFEKYSFNTLDRYDNYLVITYNRPFDHSIVIGMFYDYEKGEWNFTYNHNYKRCENSHLNGYRFFDLLFN